MNHNHLHHYQYYYFYYLKTLFYIIKLLTEGNDVALVSDAGYPLISDPGYLLVNEVIENGFNIVTVSGPNAALNGLVASGLETNHYLFYGFLNSKSSQARKELEELKLFPYTIVFYEAPHRIEKTLKLMNEVLGDRKACLARELTKLHEQYHRGTLSQLCELHDLKGEMVLIVEGYKKKEEEINLDSVLDEIDNLISSGMKTKSAINEASKKYDLSKNNLYNLYLKERRIDNEKD